MYSLYIKRAEEIYGVQKTRQNYEKAIEDLNEENTREMCLRFAEMETKLGEVDRARAIYAHCSQICDPRVWAINLRMTFFIYFMHCMIFLYQRLQIISGKCGKNLK